MQRKAIIFSNFFDGFVKNASSLRLGNELRRNNFSVTQIHHFIYFSDSEISIIIDRFRESGGEYVCISTSFLSEEHNQNENPTNHTWGVSESGVDVFKKLLFLCIKAKSVGCIVIMGGWEINNDKFDRAGRYKRWGFDLLEKYVDSFVFGNGAQPIIDYESKWKSTKIINAPPTTDYSDISTAPTKEDYINPQESLSIEMAAGCIFSCHFCAFGSLGKKKHEYVRDFDSLKREFVSNYENFGTRMYNLTDNISNDYQEKMKWLIRIRDETGIDIRWAGYVRLDTIKNKQQADLLRDSGMVGALMGVESFTPSVGKYIGKMTDKNRLVDILHMCRESWKDNAIISTMWIAGLPSETEDQMIATQEFIWSDEGQHLIDTYKWSKLHVNDGQDEKNEINKARSGPFKDYKIAKGDSGLWISPWHNSVAMDKLVAGFNDFNKFKTFITAHNIPQVCNFGHTPEEVALMARKGFKKRDLLYMEKTGRLLQNYKKTVLADFTS